MTILSAMKTNVARDLRDTGKVTFDDTTLGDLIGAALVAIGRIAPAKFQQDIPVVANALTYQPLPTTFTTPTDQLEILGVELWDFSQTPPMPEKRLAPASEAYVVYSETGWKLWGGILSIPRWVSIYVKGKEANYKLRIWGYRPYPAPASDSVDLGLTTELEFALRAYCKLQALERLAASRELFSQWQVRSNNTDMSPAALLNALSLAQADWGRLSRQIQVLREVP